MCKVNYGKLWTSCRLKSAFAQEGRTRKKRKVQGGEAIAVICLERELPNAALQTKFGHDVFVVAIVGMMDCDLDRRSNQTQPPGRVSACPNVHFAHKRA
jgi:hypothetical protein